MCAFAFAFAFAFALRFRVAFVAFFCASKLVASASRRVALVVMCFAFALNV